MPLNLIFDKGKTMCTTNAAEKVWRYQNGEIRGSIEGQTTQWTTEKNPQR